MKNQTPLEPFRTAVEIVASGLFPGLTEEKLRYYVRQGHVRAYGPGKHKTYLVSQVYDDWQKIGRSYDGVDPLPQRSQGVGGGLSKAWKKV